MGDVANMNVALGPDNSYLFPTIKASANLPGGVQTLLDEGVRISSLFLGVEGQYAVVYLKGETWFLGEEDERLISFQPVRG